MRHKTFILVAVLVAAMLAGAVAVYAYDSSREGTIAEGVTVAGVDVGGTSAARARRVVRREVSAPLERPIVVTYRGRRFELSPSDARLHADVGGMIDEALRASRDGTILSRVARDLTGGEEDAQVPARISYSRRAVRRLVASVERSVNRKPRDARVEFPSLRQVSERTGVELESRRLQRRLERVLVAPGARRVIRAPAQTTRPKVTRAQLADRYPIVLVTDRRRFELRLYKRLRLVRTYTVAVGAAGYDTPAGLYRIQNKAVNPAWHVPKKPWAGSLAGRVIPGGTADNPLKARWLGIYDGAGIHGTDDLGSLGRAASHGCIRMAIPDVIGLYEQVPVGAPVYIS